MLEVVQRVTDLEATLERFIRHTDQGMAELRETMAEIKADTAAQAGRHDQMMAEMKADEARCRAAINKQWSDLAKKMGTIVEDIVAPNVPRIARDHFGLALIERFAIRMRVRHPVERGKEREFDVICAGPTRVIWTDVKATARQEYVAAFVAAQPQFRGYFPEYRVHELFPVFASFHLPPDQLRYLTGQRVYGLAMGEETMELANLAELQPRQP